MRVLDRYIVLSFVKVFLGSLVVFSISAVTLDFFSRVDVFFKAEQVAGTFAEDYSALGKIALFYAAYLPYLLKEVLPFVTVAAGLFTINAMLRGNEIFPVLAAGVSARRVLLPLLLCGLVVCAGHVAFQESVLPSLNRELIALKRFFEGDRKTHVEDLTHLRDGKGSVTRAERYSFADQSLEDVVVQRPWTAAGFERWVLPRLEPAGEAWTAPQGGAIHPPGVGSLPRPIAAGATVDIGVSPDEVEALASKKGAGEVSLRQILRLARKFPERRNLQVAFHKQIARPFTSFVLLLLGIPMLLAMGRSVFLGGAVAFGLSAGFYLLDIFLTSLGDRGDLAPALAAYLPLGLFLSLGVARFATVPT